MNILAIETSAGPASCAVISDDRLIVSAALHTKQTHSQTLLPMVKDLLQNSGLHLDDMDVLAVAAGPGSFTGVRIGVAAVKGLAFAKNIPCARVSTLAAMAQNFRGLPINGVIAAVMDARCQQVYTALFSCENGVIRRLTADEALPIDELCERLRGEKRPVLLVGDGAAVCEAPLRTAVTSLYLAPEHLRYQNAVGVAFEARLLAENGECIPATELLPLYLRLPQAERELRQRQAAGNKGLI